MDMEEDASLHCELFTRHNGRGVFLMRSYTEVITPDKASALLRTVKDNRSLNQNWVSTLSRDMESNHWKLTPQGIVLDEQGEVLDGQHRLAALVKANVAVEFWVTEGWPRSTFRQLDGGRMRTMADRLKIEGSANPTQLAAIARQAFYWETGQFWAGRLVPSREELQMVIDIYPELKEAAQIAHVGNWSAINLPASMAGMAWWLFQKSSVEDADWTMERLKDGDGMDKGNGILTARERLIGSHQRADGQSFYHPKLKLAWLIRGWNAHRDNEKLTRIIFKNPLTNENFPVPH
jgi:hypothetical protein